MADTIDMASRIRDLMDARKVTQGELAKATGMHQPAIARALSGRSNPTAATLQKMLDYLEHGNHDPIAFFRKHHGTSGALKKINLRSKSQPVDWIVDGLVARGCVTVLAGMGGGGKSLLCQNIAISVARGDKEFVGMKVQHGHVVYLDAENGANEILRRVKRFKLTDTAMRHIHIAEASGGFDLEGDSEKLHDSSDTTTATSLCSIRCQRSGAGASPSANRYAEC